MPAVKTESITAGGGGGGEVSYLKCAGGKK